MKIVSKEQNKERIEDGIDTLLSLSEESFATVLERLSTKKSFLEYIDFCYSTDQCEVPEADIQLGLETERDKKGNYIGRSYFGFKSFPMVEIFKLLHEKMESFQEDSPEYARIQQLLATRNLEAFKDKLLYENHLSREIVDKAFGVVQSDEGTQKFLDFENNKEFFSVDGQEVPIKDYLQILGSIFGNRVLGKLSDDNTISKNFYIPELDEYKKRYLEVFNNINMDRYVNPTYEFKSFSGRDHITDIAIKKNEEPEWTINEELRKAIFQDMPEDFTLEEKAIYVYCKLCKELSYDEGYLFHRDVDERYDSEFSKEKLEAIKPGSKITCWDFSRIYAKILNTELGEGIEAVVISQGMNQGHFLTGFYTDKVSVMLDAVNARELGNDLMKAKNGVEFGGIDIISDREGRIFSAIKKVYPLVFGREQVSIHDYLEELKGTEREEVPNDVERKLEAFLETMREHRIIGNEAIQTLKAYNSAGFFGEELELAYIGGRKYANDKKTYKMMSLIRRKKENTQGQTRDLYVFDAENSTIEKEDPLQVKQKLDSKEYVYEDEKHKMPGLEEGMQ